MEMELLVALFTQNTLYSIMAVMIIIVCVVWLMKQCVIVACKLAKAYKEIESSEN